MEIYPITHREEQLNGHPDQSYFQIQCNPYQNINESFKEIEKIIWDIGKYRKVHLDERNILTWYKILYIYSDEI